MWNKSRTQSNIKNLQFQEGTEELPSGKPVIYLFETACQTPILLRMQQQNGHNKFGKFTKNKSKFENGGLTKKNELQVIFLQIFAQNFQFDSGVSE